MRDSGACIAKLLKILISMEAIHHRTRQHSLPAAWSHSCHLATIASLLAPGVSSYLALCVRSAKSCRCVAMLTAICSTKLYPISNIIREVSIGAA